MRPGCSIIRASLPFANIGVLCAAAHSPCICSRLRVALRCAQQPTGLTLPSGALMVSLPSQISAFCALAARSPCICSHLRVALRCAQQPTGLTLPSGALRVALPPPVASAHRAHASLRAFGRSQRSHKMLRHKALGLCPKPRQGPEAPAPRTLSTP